MDIYSIGWRAAVSGGQTITARVYEATGTTRGSLISEGTVIAREFSPMWWHDVPVAARLESGQDYDIEIVMNSVVEWEYWAQASTLPYTQQGLLLVTGTESDGNVGATTRIVRLRAHGCEYVASSVGDGAVPRAVVHLSAPMPNPVTGTSTIEYQLDEPAPVEISLYDVAGRTVSSILKDTFADRNGIASITSGHTLIAFASRESSARSCLCRSCM